MESARLVWELSHAQRTGVAVIDFGVPGVGRARVELVRGWIHAVDLEPVAPLFASGRAPFRLAPRGEDRLTLLLRRHDALWTFDAHLPLRQLGAVTPFHPAAIVRNIVAAHLPEADAWRARAGSNRLRLVMTPHASCLGLDEKPLVSWLAQPRTLAELDAARLCPPSRAARLLAFLDAVGALTMDLDVQLALVTLRDAYQLLELPDGAPLDEVKRAYRRLARALHPDLHPEASPEQHRDLERRFAAVSAAYRRLL
jgi:hypothetical protein